MIGSFGDIIGEGIGGDDDPGDCVLLIKKLNTKILT